MKSLFLILALVLYSSSIFSQSNETRRNRPIIDMHMHTGLPHHIPEGVPSLCRPEPCEGDGHAVTDPEQLMNKSMEQMDRYNIVLAFLSGTDLSAVKAWKNKAPERFIASPFILKPGKDAFQQLKKQYEAGEFKGMGEIGTQLMGFAANDQELMPYFKLAMEYDLPVLIHSAGIGPYTPQFRSAAGNPFNLEEVLKKYPNLRLFVENAGYPYKEEMIAMMYQYPQLYADMSTITWVIPRQAFYDYLKAFVDAGLVKRLMYGSDQMVWPEKIGESIEAIEQASFLTEDQKRDILYNNAVRFLRLKDAAEK